MQYGSLANSQPQNLQSYFLIYEKHFPYLISLILQMQNNGKKKCLFFLNPKKEGK